MSMHMIRGVQVHGKMKKKLTPKDRLAAIEHEKFLKKMGVGKTKARNTNTIPDYSSNNKVKLSNKVAGHGPAKESTQYTGDYIIGIGQMHKSNGVPITRKEDAIAIANMRR
tara:strand:- start:24 stop:356 length:333 start_codon:yes stop_codon:yes gene_type:complete